MIDSQDLIRLLLDKIGDILDQFGAGRVSMEDHNFIMGRIRGLKEAIEAIKDAEQQTLSGNGDTEAL